MRLVVWNCHQALDKKMKLLADLRPDIAIIPECANPTLPRLAKVLKTHEVNQTAWCGKNPHKGLGVFVFKKGIVDTKASQKRGGDFSIKVDVNHKTKFSLLALWTQWPGYVEEIHKTVHAYRKVFDKRDVIIAGDFNSNTIWDSNRTLNHSELVKRLSDEFGLRSVYHHHFDEEHGAESRGTFYFTYNAGKPYHLDYIFIPKKWLSKVRSFDVGSFGDWKHASDHCPLVLDLGI